MTNRTKTQEWRPIEGYPTYEVSNWGRVRRWYPDTVGNGVPYASNLKPSAAGTVGLERVKGSRVRVVRTVASLQLAAFPPEAELDAASHEDVAA